MPQEVETQNLASWKLNYELISPTGEIINRPGYYLKPIGNPRIEYGNYYVGLPMIGPNKIYVDIRQVKELIDLYYTGMKIFYLTEAKEEDGSKKMISYTTSYDSTQKDFKDTHPCFDADSYPSKGRMVSLNSILPYDIRINESAVLSPLWKKSPLYGIQ